MKRPELYIKANSFQRRDLENFLGVFLKKMTWKKAGEGETIVDLGCGPGDATFEILHPKLQEKTKLKFLIGADISGDMINFALNNYKHPNMTYSVVDLRKSESTKCIPFHGKIDKAFSFFTFQFFEDKTQPLSNIFNMLRPGGEIFITFPAFHPFMSILGEIRRQDKWSKHVERFPPIPQAYKSNQNPVVEFEKNVESAGFQMIYNEGLELSHKYENMAAFKDALKAVSNDYQNLPDKLKEEFVGDLTEVIKKTTSPWNDEDSKEIIMKYFMVSVIARTPHNSNEKCN